MRASCEKAWEYPVSQARNRTGGSCPVRVIRYVTTRPDSGSTCGPYYYRTMKRNSTVRVQARPKRSHIREINASRITLYDDRRRPTIWLDGGGKNGHASIVIMSRAGQSAQFQVQPGGHVTLS